MGGVEGLLGVVGMEEGWVRGWRKGEGGGAVVGFWEGRGCEI